MKTANFVQGCYYLLTGAWPVLHIESFLQLTGDKHDIWLVKMVGLLSVSIGLALVTKPYGILAFCAAFSFVIIDVHYVDNGTIPKVYLVDAIIQLFFIAWLIWTSQKKNVECLENRD